MNCQCHYWPYALWGLAWPAIVMYQVAWRFLTTFHVSGLLAGHQIALIWSDFIYVSSPDHRCSSHQYVMLHSDDIQQVQLHLTLFTLYLNYLLTC
jgi:hypothetical protein